VCGIKNSDTLNERDCVENPPFSTTPQPRQFVLVCIADEATELLTPVDDTSFR